MTFIYRQILLVLSFVCIISLMKVNAAIISSFQSGNWNNGTTWTGGNVPALGDSVIIQSTHNVTISAAPTNIPGGVNVIGTLIINNNQTLTISASPSSLPATFGTFGGAGATTLGGSNCILILNGDYSFSGTLSQVNRLRVTFNGANNQTITGTATWRVITVNKTGGELIVTTSPTISTTTTLTSGNICYNSGTNQTILNANHPGNLTVSNTGTNLLAPIANRTITGNLLINDGATFNVDAFTLTVTGTTTIGNGMSGTLNITSATAVKLFVGTVTLNLGATWNNAINSACTFRGGISNSGTFIVGTGLQLFNTNSQTLTGISAIPNITVNSPTVLTLTNSFTISTALAGSGILQISSSTLSIQGTCAISSIDALTNTPNLVEYNGTSDQTILGETYYNLKINCAGYTATLAGTVTVNGYLQIESGSTFDPAAQALTVNGATNIIGTFQDGTLAGVNTFTDLVTVNIGAIWNSSVVTAVGNMIFKNGINNLGTFNAAAATFNTNSQTITGISAIPSITVNGAGIVLSPDQAFTISTALAGTGGFRVHSLGLTLSGTSVITSLDASTNAPNLVEYNGTANQTVKGTTYSNLRINCTGFIARLGGATTVNGYLVIESGSTFQPAGVNLTANGVTNIYGTFGESGAGGTDLFKGKVTIYAGGSWNFTVAETPFFENGLEFNGTTFVSGSGTYTFQTNNQTIGGTQPFTINGAVTITAITLTNASTTGVTIMGTLGGTGTFIQGLNSIVSLGNTNTVSTFNVTTNTPNTVYYCGTVAQNIRTASYYNLYISGTSIKTLSAGTTSVSNSLNVLSGTLQMANRILNVTGSTTISAGGTIDDNSTTGTNTFNNLTIEGIWTSTGNESYTINGNLVINAGASITSGTGIYTFAGSSKTISGTVSNAVFSNINITGSYTNTANITSATTLSGTGILVNGLNGTLKITGTLTISSYDFTTNANTVIYGANTVTAANFYNLSIDNIGGTTLLNNNILVNNVFNFITAGNLNLQGHNLTMQNWNNGDIPNNLSTDKTIVLNNGTVVINGVDVGETAIFPVSITSALSDYARIDITNNDPVNTTFSVVGLCANVYTDGTCSGSSGGDQIVENGINITYFINSSSTNADVTYYWHTSKELLHFDRSDCVLNHYDAVNGWEQKGIAGAANLYSSSIYYKSGTFTSFSPGGVGPGNHELPIELISFEAEQVPTGVDLLWKTASEENNDFFTLEKSTDGIHFSEIQIVKGAGNSSSVKQYMFNDKNTNSGIIYYRLKQTDFDGKSEYSNTISINFDTQVETFVFPNPSTGKVFNVTFENTKSSSITIKLTKINGAVVFVKNYEITDGLMTIQIVPDTYISPGMYIIKGMSENGEFNQPILVK